VRTEIYAELYFWFSRHGEAVDHAGRNEAAQ
jgi:hypothetical protein